MARTVHGRPGIWRLLLDGLADTHHGSTRGRRDGRQSSSRLPQNRCGRLIPQDFPVQPWRSSALPASSQPRPQDASILVAGCPGIAWSTLPALSYTCLSAWRTYRACQREKRDRLLCRSMSHIHSAKMQWSSRQAVQRKCADLHRMLALPPQGTPILTFPWRRRARGRNITIVYASEIDRLGRKRHGRACQRGMGCSHGLSWRVLCGMIDVGHVSGLLVRSFCHLCRLVNIDECKEPAEVHVGTTSAAVGLRWCGHWCDGHDRQSGCEPWA